MLRLGNEHAPPQGSFAFCWFLFSLHYQRIPLKLHLEISTTTELTLRDRVGAYGNVCKLTKAKFVKKTGLVAVLF